MPRLVELRALEVAADDDAGGEIGARNVCLDKRAADEARRPQIGAHERRAGKVRADESRPGQPAAGQDTFGAGAAKGCDPGDFAIPGRPERLGRHRRDKGDGEE